MKVLVLVVMMVVTVVITNATLTNKKGLFGCTYDEQKLINRRLVVDWMLAINECDKTLSTYTACTDRQGDCMGNLKKMNGKMTEDDWTKVKENYQDCSDSLNANIKVNEFPDIMDVKHSCPSLDQSMAWGFTAYNFFPMYRCVAQKTDLGEFNDFKNCINGK